MCLVLFRIRTESVPIVGQSYSNGIVFTIYLAKFRISLSGRLDTVVDMYDVLDDKEVADIRFLNIYIVVIGICTS